MENLYSSLIILSGLTTTLLGAFLLVSERQLKNKQRELDEFRRKQNVEPVKPSVRSEASELVTKNAQLEKEIASLSSQLEQSTRRVQEADEHRETSEAEITALKRQLEERGEAIESLENVKQAAAKLRSEHQELFNENRRLQEDMVRIRGQVQSSDEQLHATSTQHRALGEQHAQLQRDFAEAKQHADKLADKNQELLEEAGRLSTKLIASEKSFEEFRAIQEGAHLENQQVSEANQQLREEIAILQKQLTKTESQLDESAAHNKKLQHQTDELKVELEKQKASIDELQAVQSDSQGLRVQNQVLQQELEKHRTQLNASAARLEQAAEQNQELTDRCAQLETEGSDWKQRLEDSQSKVQELESMQQQLANLESREMLYREQEQKLETRILELGRELVEAKNQQEQKTELEDENQRLRVEMAQRQERLAAGEENRKQVNILRELVGKLQMENERLVDEKLRAQNKIVANGEPVEDAPRVASDSSETESLQNTGSNTAEQLPIQDGLNEASDKQASTELAEDVKAALLDPTSVKRKWSARAVPVVVVVLIASAIFVGLLGGNFLTLNEPTVAPEISANEFAADEDSKPQTKPSPRLRGAFETIRSTQVYSAPSKDAPLIANIGPGMKLNVVDSRDGWLEVRSRHGRPPGFIRQEAAVRIGQN